MSRPNEWGVYTQTDSVIVSEYKPCVRVSVVQDADDGLWRFGTFYLGATGGYVVPPNKRNKGYKTRQEAIEAGILDIARETGVKGLLAGYLSKQQIGLFDESQNSNRARVGLCNRRE